MWQQYILLKIRLVCDSFLTECIHSRDGNMGTGRQNVWNQERRYDGWMHDDSVRKFRILPKDYS